MAQINKPLGKSKPVQINVSAAFENRERRLRTQRTSLNRKAPPPRGYLACRFLRQLTPVGLWVLTAIHPDDRRQITTNTFTDIEDAREFIAEHNAAGRGVYYSVNPTKTALQSKAKKTDIARIEYLHVDADPGKDETPEAFKERMLAKIAEFPHCPTFVIDSGNGLQLLFKLSEAVEITASSVIADIESRNHALALAFGADPSTRNIDRVFRLPGTINYPNEPKRKLGRQICRTHFFDLADESPLEAFPDYPLETFPPYMPSSESEATDNAENAGSETIELSALLRTLLMIDDSGAGARHGVYETRSHLTFAFLTSAIKARLADATIIEACLDPRYAGKGIFEHIKESGGYIERQLQRAHEKTGHGHTLPESIHSWDEPDPSILDDRRGELPDFPLDVLEPQRLRDWVEQQAQTTGTTVDHVAVPFLGICSGMIGKSRLFQVVRSWAEPATDWVCTVGYSGSGKTPGLDATRLPLDELEAQRSEQNAAHKRAHDQQTAQAEIAKSNWQREAKQALKDGQPAPPMPNAAIKPDE
jgi:hypothetical protein